MTAKKKLKSRAGFTLAETMLAVLILLLVSGIVAAGMPAAKNAYKKVVLASNAEVLLSTAASALRDELGTAWKVQQTSDGDGVTYFSADTGMRTKLYIDGSIKIQQYSEATAREALLGLDKANTGTARDLVYQSSKDAVKYTLTAKKISVDRVNNQDVVKIDGLCVINGKTPLATMDLEIPVFSVEAGA